MKLIMLLYCISLIVIYGIFAAEEASLNFIVWDKFIQGLIIFNFIVLTVFFIIEIYRYNKIKDLLNEEHEQQKDEIPTDMLH